MVVLKNLITLGDWNAFVGKEAARRVKKNNCILMNKFTAN